ncbi:MAG TPA: carbohydrate kinase family protein [Pirellulales bacterium]|jgi:sugar/nucleoside kinase (ribokinase family)|nr:carbohydrate kinase family protein [Pirellulales bacterium]
MNRDTDSPTSDEGRPDARGEANSRPPISVLSAGILVVDHLSAPIARLPRAGELVLCDRLPLAIGGCAANVAIDLARVGVRVGVVGCVGRDPFGQFLIDRLAADGIETSDVRMLEGIDTSGTLIINVAGEDRRFIHSAGANAVTQASHIPPERVRQAKVFYVGGYLLMPALERPGALVELFRRARAVGVKTVLDVVVPGPGDHWPKLEALLAETDVFLPNEDEAALITALADPLDQAARFRDAGAGTVVITQGERGTLLVSNDRRVRAGAYPTEFVGGTGAGDAFDAGYVAGLLAGEDTIGCLKWGAALGASCVRSISATESVLTREEAVAFMREHELRIEPV